MEQRFKQQSFIRYHAFSHGGKQLSQRSRNQVTSEYFSILFLRSDSLFIRYEVDDLSRRSVGRNIRMYFGSTKTKKILLFRSMEDSEGGESYHTCSSHCENCTEDSGVAVGRGSVQIGSHMISPISRSVAAKYSIIDKFYRSVGVK